MRRTNQPEPIMRHLSLPLFLTVVLAAMSADALAQYGTHTEPLNTVVLNQVPRSIELARHGNHLYALCSMTTQSEQISVRVTNPTAPVEYASATFTRDQYCDAIYTPAFGGRLLTAHRFGGIQAWEATSTTVIGALPTIGPLNSTNYSHEGLRTFTDPFSNRTFVLYAEQHTSPTSVGGLELYELNASGPLTYIGDHLQTGKAGRTIELSRDGRIVWMWGDTNNNYLDGELRTYSTNGYTGNPILLDVDAYPFVNGYPDKDLVRNHNQNNLVSTLGWDGLAAVNLSVVSNPTINTIVGPSTVLFLDGATFFPGTDFCLIWGFLRFGSIDWDFMLVADASVPGLVLPMFTLSPGFRVDDVKIENGRLYCVGRDRASTPAMAPILVIF
jgi:hypothetical protein